MKEIFFTYNHEKINKIIADLDIKVICPGFDLNFWSGTEKKYLPDEKILRLKPYILSVGALKFRKGYHNSVLAFSIIARRFEHLNYVIIGQGEESNYAQELKKIIKENNLENRVFFISSVVDDETLLGLYRNAELFLLTPVEENHHFEGFGIVYLEAAASGLPIVATFNSGAVSATKDGFNSILVSQNDPQRVAEAISKILSNDEAKKDLKNNSYEWVKNFSWDKIVMSYNEIYNAYTQHN